MGFDTSTVRSYDKLYSIIVKGVIDMNNWYNQSVFYHIYPLGLCNAEQFNDYDLIHHRFHPLYEWTDHFIELGCNGLYIGPLFESVGHGYETTNYCLVDRRLGDNKDFIDYVKYCHKHKIKVVVDGVFNHTGRDFFAFADLRENGENSKYRNWYCSINFHEKSSYQDNFTYECWRGCQELPKLNLNNKEVVNYLVEVVKFWITTFDIDGIRLDCADVLDFNFMRKLREETQKLKDEFWLMGEVIHGDYKRWVNEEVLHSVTDYELWKALYSSHNDHNYFELAHTAKRLFDENGGIIKDSSLYSFADNHDVNRVATLVLDKNQLIPLYILLFTLPGIPSIYYGSEYEIEGNKQAGGDIMVRPSLEYSMYKTRNKERLYQLITKLTALRKGEEALYNGQYTELFLTNRQYAFLRRSKEQILLVAVNNDECQAEITIALKETWKTCSSLLTNKNYNIENTCIRIVLQPNDGEIIKCTN